MKLIKYILEKKQNFIKVFVRLEENSKTYLKELGDFKYINSNWVFNFTTEETNLINFFNDMKIEDLEIIDLNSYTTPTLNPFYVEIPNNMLFVFPEDKFIVGDFIVELTINNNKRYVNTAYLEWQSFKDELDAPQNAPLKRSLEYVWDFVRLQANTILPYLQDPQNNTLSPYILIIQ